MALTQRSQVKIWSIVAVVFLALMWLLGDVILPFVLGAAIAYLLDPLADWLEARGLSRAASVSIITLVSVMIFVVFTIIYVLLLAY